MKPGDKITLTVPVAGDMDTVPKGTEATLVRKDEQYECLWEAEAKGYGRFMVNGEQFVLAE